MMYRAPGATYRVQMNSEFTLARLRSIVGYLSRLGVTDLYLSPILKARSGSAHGYDVVDSNQLNPELGTETELLALRDDLRARGMGVVLDIVPNHMAASSDNAWWYDVLEHGAESQYVDYFDVDWEPFTAHGSLKNRVLIPILGRPYGEVLEGGELRLGYDDGTFYVAYFEHRLPIAPRSYPMILGLLLDGAAQDEASWSSELRELISSHDRRAMHRTPQEARAAAERLKEGLRVLYAREAELRNAVEQTVQRFNGQKSNPQSFDPLDALMESQWYRLAYWRMASEEINYRRFFDVTDLVGLRVERNEIFEARHAKVFEWVRSGVVTGLRIDHIDGLYDPVAYLRRLQNSLGGPDSNRFYVVVEKILAVDERLPESFACDGTTGYEFLNEINDVFVDAANLGRLSAIYEQFIGEGREFPELAYQAKRQVLEWLFAGEIRALGASLARLASHDRNARDFAPIEITQALAEVTAALTVYRTYIRDFHITPFDRQVIADAIALAAARNRDRLDRRMFGFIERVLLLQTPHYASEHRGEWLDFVMRWQQFTGRAMAKGIEDTAFYQFNRLISLNEVGGEADARQPFDSLERFHSANLHRLEHWPASLNTTSTHDTKRSADVRARIDVLSEMPELWERHLRSWGRLNHALKKSVSGRSAPDRNEEVLIYQSLIGAWPLDGADEATIPDRMAAFMEKALREAKTNSSWVQPDHEYERAVLAFVREILAPANEEFLNDFRAFQQHVAYYGFLNSLSQIVLKVFSPGAADFYQGEELWDFSLVDPDNRRPVDFALRQSLLEEVLNPNVEPSTLAAQWIDGRVKMLVTARSLAVRQAHSELFTQGDYRRLSGSGNSDRHLCAFARVGEKEAIIVAVPRLCASLVAPGELPVGAVWENQALELPSQFPQRWRNTMTGELLDAAGIGGGESSLPLGELFGSFPLAVLERAE